MKLETEEIISRMNAKNLLNKFLIINGNSQGDGINITSTYKIS